MEKLNCSDDLYPNFKKKDRIEVGKCLVPNAIDDYLAFEKRKYPVKYKNGYYKYWNRNEFENIPESLLKVFGEIYLISIDNGLDLIDIGENIYKIGIERKLPGFIRKDFEQIKPIESKRYRIFHLL